MSDLLTLKQAAEIAGLSYERMRQLIKEKRLPAYLDGFGHYRIQRADLVEFLAKPRSKGGRPVKTG